MEVWEYEMGALSQDCVGRGRQTIHAPHIKTKPIKFARVVACAISNHFADMTSRGRPRKTEALIHAAVRFYSSGATYERGGVFSITALIM